MEKAKKTRKTGEFIKVKQLIRLCEKSNVTRVSVDGIHLEFGARVERKSAKKVVDTQYVGPESKYLETPSVDMPPDDVMLFAATDHFENILEERKADKEK